MRSILASVTAAGAMLSIGLTSPLSASAQPFPNETIQGTVQKYDGGEHLYVADVRGFIDDVALGDQTAIRPAGTQLAPGMTVTIHGYNAGHWFDATSIDIGGSADVQAPPPPQPDQQPPMVTAPPPTDDESVVAPPPPAVVYPPYAYAYGYPYPYYPPPVYYGWYGGSWITLGIGVGGGWTWHGRPYHGRVWGGGYRGSFGAYRGPVGAYGGGYRGVYGGGYRGVAGGGYRGAAGGGFRGAGAARGGGGHR